MENFQTTVNVDELFSKWRSAIEEVKRKVLGKYTEKNESFDITDKTYVYQGPEICTHKFDFSYPGNRCKMCSSILFLSDVGEIDHEVKIEHGKRIGDTIVVECFVPPTRFGFYENLGGSLDTLLSRVSPASFFNRKFYKDCVAFQNNASDKSHYVVMSCLFQEFGNKTRYINSYMCNSLKIVKLVPQHIGTTQSIKMTKDFVRSILNSIVFMCEDGNVVHGQQEMSYLSFDIKKSKIVTYIEPSDKTTFSVKGYHDRHIFLLSRHQNLSQQCEYVASKSIFTKDERFACFLNDFKPVFPVINREGFYYTEYVESNRQLFEYYEKTGINIFPEFQIYIWLFVLMCEKNIFDHLPEEMFSFMFFSNQVEHIKHAVTQRHNSVTTYSDIRDLMIRLNVKMRIDGTTIIKNVIENT